MKIEIDIEDVIKAMRKQMDLLESQAADIREEIDSLEEKEGQIREAVQLIDNAIDYLEEVDV